MARWETEQTVTQSLLERLIDRDPAAGAEAPMMRAQSVRLLKASLRRDLEWLLNTRRIPEPVPEGCEQLESSLYSFGLPDVTSLNYEVAADRNHLARMLERTIALFEPRLERLKVNALEPVPGATHVLRFQIEGLLMMDPAPELISFDTVLQLASGEYHVKGEQASAG